MPSRRKSARSSAAARSAHEVLRVKHGTYFVADCRTVAEVAGAGRPGDPGAGAEGMTVVAAGSYHSPLISQLNRTSPPLHAVFVLSRPSNVS